MNVTERRKKILEIFYEKKSLNYKEILEETSRLGDPVDILSDIDTLVSFRFLQNVGVKRSEINPETKLELRPNTRNQIENNPSRIDSRLEELGREFPPWYRKRAVLTVLNGGMEFDTIFQRVCDQYPHVRWSPLLVKASLRILREYSYVSAEKQRGTEQYTLTSEGVSLLGENPIQQFNTLKNCKDEFSTEFRAYEILKLVRDHNKSGISSGGITRHFQKKYGIRGNKRKAVRNTLENMVYPGLLRVSEGTKKRGGHVYFLGEAAESLAPMEGQVIIMENHDIKEFKKTVEQLFSEHNIFDIKRGDKSSIEQILDDLEQCKQDLSSRLPEEWAAHIVFLTDHLRNVKADTWEKKAFQCISACILSRLLPAEVSVSILKDYPPPPPPPDEYHHLNIGIASEYYFNLSEAYFTCGEYEKAFESFERLELVCRESFDFYILKGRINMLKCDMRKISEAHEILSTFGNALRLAKGKERIVALFYMGMAQYRRVSFRELKEKLDPETPENAWRYKELEKRTEPKTPADEWERKGAKEIWESCLKMGCTVNQEIIVRHNLAEVCRLVGELEKAKENYEYNIVLAGNFPEREESKYKSLVGLVNVLIDLCLWDEAEEKVREILDRCTEKFPLVASVAKTSRGVLLDRQGKYKEALACHREGLDLVKKEHNPGDYGAILINVADTLRHLKRADEAMNTLEEAGNVIGKEDITLTLALEISMADLFIDVGNLDESWRLSHSVLQEKWRGDRRPEADALRIQGKILFCRNEFHKAVKSLSESEEIFKELNLKYELLEIYRLLEECYGNLKDEERKSFYKNAREDLVQQTGLQFV